MSLKPREARVVRRTRETDIEISLKLDGRGDYRVRTAIPFFTHMLEIFAKHGSFDLKLRAEGDVEVDDHHLVEDVGLVLGKAFAKAVGDKKGLRRYGFFTLPMDETLTTAAVDFCGRPVFVYHSPLKRGRIKTFDVQLAGEFFRAFASSAEVNLHLVVHYCENRHHAVESLFKAFAKALDVATSLDPRTAGRLPSTKGVL